MITAMMKMSSVGLSELKTKTQAFMYTVTRKIQLLRGQIVRTVTTLQRDYFEKNE